MAYLIIQENIRLLTMAHSRQTHLQIPGVTVIRNLQKWQKFYTCALIADFTLFCYRKQLYLWLVACIVSLITSISVSPTFFLNVLEIRLLILGQLITSTSTSDDTDTSIEFRQLPYYCPHLFTLYDQYSDESFNTWHLAQLHGALLHGDGDESVTESESEGSVDSLSTIAEEEVQDNMEELLAPHLEELLGEIFPPHLPPLALPG